MVFRTLGPGRLPAHRIWAGFDRAEQVPVGAAGEEQDAYRVVGEARHPKPMSWIRLMRLMTASVRPFETRDLCQAMIWSCQRRSVRPRLWASIGWPGSAKSFESSATNRSAAGAGSSMA